MKARLFLALLMITQVAFGAWGCATNGDGSAGKRDFAAPLSEALPLDCRRRMGGDGALSVRGSSRWGHGRADRLAVLLGGVLRNRRFLLNWSSHQVSSPPLESHVLTDLAT